MKSIYGEGCLKGRAIFLLIGLMITLSGLVLWNIPLENSEDGTASIYSQESGFSNNIVYVGWGFSFCFCLGPYVILSGMAGAPLFLSAERWGFQPPE